MNENGVSLVYIYGHVCYKPRAIANTLSRYIGGSKTIVAYLRYSVWPWHLCGITLSISIMFVWDELSPSMAIAA